ncbi:hypothetical protein AZE42_04178 [Rhizopogon vesiculosus]|uniref:Uncharacterized protein n=1 Tax=Rhizopogon vesiculosus TaxID=180088 RepID=A0A1J8Q8W0_9AGAM|nr:hypothetical protein AZE42_04178 [Rhizopogon vesiculosus]
MSIRRKSTTHDLATLRLHPDGSRVQQSSVNRKLRKARSTVSDIRGNWIARDAGGRADVSKTRTRTATAGAQAQDGDGEIFDIHLSDDLGEEGLTTRTNAKGKQKATESDAEDSSGGRTGKDSRARKRLGFTQDLSFLAPSPFRFTRESGLESELSSEDNSSSESASEAVKITLPDPSPELLKCIHHFASRYYQEKGVLSDRSRDHRGERKARQSKKGEANIHYQTTTKPALWTRHSSLDGDDDDDDDDDHDDEWEDEDDDEMEDEDMEDAEEGEGASRQEGHLKDMYKALDGSALVAIGIILQEQIAHTMTAGFSSSHSRRVQRRDDPAE